MIKGRNLLKDHDPLNNNYNMIDFVLTAFGMFLGVAYLDLIIKIVEVVQ